MNVKFQLQGYKIILLMLIKKLQKANFVLKPDSEIVTNKQKS